VVFHPQGRIVATRALMRSSSLGRENRKQIGSPWGHCTGHSCVIQSGWQDHRLECMDKSVRFWEVLPEGKQAAALAFQLCRCLAISPDGKIIASGGADKTCGSGLPHAPAGGPAIIHSGLYSPPPSVRWNTVLTGSDTQACVGRRDWKTVGAAFEHRARVDSVMFSPTASRFLPAVTTSWPESGMETRPAVAV